MLLDMRTYTCRPGTIKKHLEVYERLGKAPQTKHLGQPLAYLVTETGDPNQYVHIWVYKDAADREKRRAAMQADPDWVAYTTASAELGALAAQENKLMRPVDFFRAAALARKQEEPHGKHDPGDGRMSLRVAIQMDPIGGIDIDADSTFMLALEGQKRGHTLFHYAPANLSFHHNALVAKGEPLTVRREHGNHASLGRTEALNLAEVDIVLMRQDPPFDMAYITATHLLEHVHPSTLVVNDPANVRNAPEKLFVTNFPELMPPTLITANTDDIHAFRREHEDIIIKPLFGNGGAGVFHIKPDDENLNVLLEMFTEMSREPVIAQAYIPEIRAGDKRIILVDGAPAGAVSRVPAAGDARANFHAGGTAKVTSLTAREQQICEAIGPTLRDQGLIFVGIDVIGDYLTEINVTSPTGIQEINRLSGTAIEADIWDAIERRRGTSR